MNNLSFAIHVRSMIDALTIAYSTAVQVHQHQKSKLIKDEIDYIAKHIIGYRYIIDNEFEFTVNQKEFMWIILSVIDSLNKETQFHYDNEESVINDFLLECSIEDAYKIIEILVENPVS